MLNFKVEGKGKALVFLHGFLESSSMWSFLKLEKLNTKNIFIDLPGHGKSDLKIDLENPSIDSISGQILLILDILKVDSYSVIGHSMGGYVSLSLKKLDKRCQKVVLLNSNFWEDSDQKKKDRIRVAEIAFNAKKLFIQEAIPNLFGKPEKHSKEVEELKNEALKILPESIAYSALAMRERKDFSNEVSTNPDNYFVIHGKLDKLVEVGLLKNQLKSHKNLFVIENAGHMAHIEQPEEVSKILQNIFS